MWRIAPLVALLTAGACGETRAAPPVAAVSPDGRATIECDRRAA
jgi:hypothetical protein